MNMQIRRSLVEHKAHLRGYTVEWRKLQAPDHTIVQWGELIGGNPEQAIVVIDDELQEHYITQIQLVHLVNALFEE